MSSEKKPAEASAPLLAPEMAFNCPRSELQDVLEESCVGALVLNAEVALPIALRIGVSAASFTNGMAQIAFLTVVRLAAEVRSVTLLEVVYAGEWKDAKQYFDDGPEDTAMRFLEKCVVRCPSVYLAPREFGLLRIEEARRIVWYAARTALQALEEKRDVWEIAKGLGDALRAMAAIKKEVGT